MRQIRELAAIICISFLSLGVCAEEEQKDAPSKTSNNSAAEVLQAKVNEIMSECQREIGEKLPGILELNGKLLHGLACDSKWYQRPSTELLRQESSPTRTEREVMFNSRGIALKYVKLVQIETRRYLYPAQDVISGLGIDYLEYIWTQFLNGCCSYREIDLVRREKINEVLERNRALGKAGKPGSQPWFDEANKQVDLLERRLAAALEENERVVAERKAAGFTFCRKLGAFEYCDTPLEGRP